MRPDAWYPARRRSACSSRSCPATGTGAYTIKIFCGGALSVLFALITLPVEFDASRRALRMLSGGAYLNESELEGAKKVLRA
ncbi:MAG: zinc metallopeptidase, partial [Lachnospiraceae bacterium]|nr:zinc metallopeptidase [Lachnospiraceae bacterium]